jgi:hypothetical protein
MYRIDLPVATFYGTRLEQVYSGLDPTKKEKILQKEKRSPPQKCEPKVLGQLVELGPKLKIH